MNSVILKSSVEPSSQNQFDPSSETPPKDIKRDLLRGFKMHRRVAIAVGLAVSLALLTFAMGRRPYYETSTLIYVQPAKARLITDPTGGTYDSNRYDTYIQQQFQTVTRPDILKQAMEEAGPGIWRFPGESDQSAITRLQKNLKIEREMGSYQLSISLSGNDPAAITKVVNAVTTTYIRKEREDELAQSDQQLQVLKAEREHILASLTASREEQVKLSSILGVADTTGETSNPYDVQLTELRTQLATARANHAVAEAQLSTIQSRGGAANPSLGAAANEIIASDPSLSTLKQANSQRRSQIASEMAKVTPKNPLYKQYEEEIKRLDQSTETLSGQLREKASKQLEDKLKLDAARTADIEFRLNTQLLQQTSIATGATPKLQRAAALAADVTRLQAHYTEVDNAISAIELENKTNGLVHLILEAKEPQKPIASKKIFILAGALPIGCLFGLLASYSLYKLDSKIYIGDDAGEVLGFPPMAVLPDPKDVDGRVIDEFLLRFAAGIDHAHGSGGARTYVFTSASPSLTITDLVRSLAQKMDRLGYRTMIVKASSALQNFAKASEDAAPTSWGETRLATTGGTRLSHLRRESFIVENLERLKENVDLLFIEALPLSTSAEAEFVARLADVTILVSRSAETTRSELKHSLELVRRLNVAGVGAVLCDLNLKNANAEFISAVRSVQSRQSEVNRRGPRQTERDRKLQPLSIYGNSEFASTDRQNSEPL